ncbi:MAG: diphthine--ammonia ligase [Nitrososphaerales archaeon]|jgi:ABC transporter with metal-binding/Fe-S-binding domain ATP-binding protein
MKVAVLWSGGKDSAYSAFLAQQRGDTIACLLTICPSAEGSWMYHYPAIQWTKLQAQSARLPQVMVPTEGVKEEELGDLSRGLKTAKAEYGIEGVYTGALASVYQKSRVDRICSELGLQSVSPLWGIDPRVHLMNIINQGFDVIMTGVAALGLDEGWLGRRLDAAMVDDLVELQRKYGMHAALEGGEGETFVLNCPIFEERIEITSSRKHWNGMSGTLEILDARLVPKGN